METGHLRYSGKPVTVYTIKHKVIGNAKDQEMRVIRDHVDMKLGKPVHQKQKVKVYVERNYFTGNDVVIERWGYNPRYERINDYILRPVMPLWQKAAVGLASVALLGMAGFYVQQNYDSLNERFQQRMQELRGK